MTVVVAYRPDRFGEAALETGMRLARQGSGRLVVVNATAGDAYVDPHLIDERQREELRGRWGDLDGTLEQPVDGDVSMAIVRAAEAHDADVLVIGVRHRSAAGKMLLGGHAHRIIMEAHCPVLCVKPSP